MDFASTPLFEMFRQRLGWLGHRQRVLAQNIANADTPGYRPKDLTEFRFDGALKAAQQTVALKQTDPRHIGAQPVSAPIGSERVDADTYEVTPTGNAVVLEEQMAKMNETALAHRAASQLYRKYLSMVRLAATSRE